MIIQGTEYYPATTRAGKVVHYYRGNYWGGASSLCGQARQSPRGGAYCKPSDLPVSCKNCQHWAANPELVRI